MSIPHLFHQVSALHWIRGPKHQHPEQRKLSRRKCHLHSGASDGASRRVNDEITHLQGRATLGQWSPKQGPHPGGELVEVKRLGDVIIGPRIEPPDSISSTIARRQH